MSTVVGDEKLTSREDQIGLLFLYVKSDENMLPKVNKISKTEVQTESSIMKLATSPCLKIFVLLSFS
ncbi:hypothetical protein ACXOO7_09170, partial [Streptococcus thermophilus]